MTKGLFISLLPCLIVLSFGHWTVPVLAIPLLGYTVLALVMHSTPAEVGFYGVRLSVPNWAKVLQTIATLLWLVSLAAGCVVGFVN